MKIDIYNTDKKYDIILADPPWKYGSKGARSGKFGELDYSNMTTRDIAAMPIGDLANKDCALELWFTASFVEDAIEVCKAWGFKVVRIDMVWNKKYESGSPHAVCGPWGISDCEFVLLGTKGKACSMQEGKRNMYTGHDVKYPDRHSEKPEYFHKLIEKRFGDKTRIEIFARDHRDGWDCFGDEVNG